jgi:SAM-dependent methyltransferase
VKPFSHQQQVRSFFDRLAPNYQGRYGAGSPFLRYFHQQRLQKALNGFSFSGKRILDVGAGSGALYHALGEPADYFATDLSEAMLEHSGIPKASQYAGILADIHFPVDSFDYIFLLGVTTYMQPDELQTSLRWIEKHLAEDGVAIISFTNRKSLDFQIRKRLKPLLSRREGVLGQSFSITALGLEEAKEMLPAGLVCSRVEWLNQTLFPFNRIFSRLAVAIAPAFESIGARLGGLPRISSDFLLILRRK